MTRPFSMTIGLICFGSLSLSGCADESQPQTEVQLGGPPKEFLDATTFSRLYTASFYTGPHGEYPSSTLPWWNTDDASLDVIENTTAVAECGPGVSAITGISGSHSAYSFTTPPDNCIDSGPCTGDTYYHQESNHVVACGGEYNIDQSQGYTLSTYYRNDERQRPSGWDDWAPWMYKAVCNGGDAITGIAFSSFISESAIPTGSYVINGNAAWPYAFRCSHIVGAYGLISNASVIDWGQGDSRRNGGSDGDWDRGWFKGECADDEVMAGIAMGGAPHGRAWRAICYKPVFRHIHSSGPGG
ncbi:MAG: hypothetical protein QOI66_1291 [Myxococcales bacterium]|jgi:hypothetical protein|nr:hypothetical protein [Myxococcales bacterium]